MSKRKIITFLLLLILTVGIFIVNIGVIENAKAQLPNITQLSYNKNSQEKGKTVSYLEKLFKRITNEDVGLSFEATETAVKEETITTTYVNEYYFSDYNTKIIGKNISAKNLKNKDNVAIIGSQLALKLYFTTNAVGKQLTVEGKQYTVCGVIQDNESIINKFSADNKQRVYIPYTTAKDYRNKSVDTIVYKNSAYTGVMLEQVELPQYYSANLNDKNQTLSTVEHILYFVIFFGICVIAIKLWYRLSKRFYGGIKENLVSQYFIKSIRQVPLKYLLFILVFLGIPALLLFGFSLCDFSIFIPSQYMPDDNIFDFSHYLNVLMDNAQAFHCLSLKGNLMLINLYSLAFTSSLWLTLMFVVCFSCVVYKIFTFDKLFNRI